MKDLCTVLAVTGAAAVGARTPQTVGRACPTLSSI